MPSYGKERLEKTLKILISDVINNELTNTNLSLTTVTGVQLSNDRSHLKVYVSFANNIDKSLEALKNATGYIKKSISEIDGIRKVPNLVFIYDKSFDQGLKIDKLIDELKIEKE